MLNKTKTLTIGRQKKAKEKALKLTKLETSLTKTTLRRTEPYKMLTSTTKPLRRRVLTEESLEKGSTKTKQKSTRRTQTSGTFVKQVVFLTVNHRGPLPLREIHSTGETIVWRDPGGSWACLPPVYDCVWNHPATGCHMWTTPKGTLKGDIN